MSSDGSEEIQLVFTSTVLSLRGDHIARQPLEHESSGSVLCWNGEAWSVGGISVQGNDAEAVFHQLTAAAIEGLNNNAGNVEEAILTVLRAIEGPFAFAYYCPAAGKIYFARDRLGRRSLLISKDDNDGSITLSSVAESTNSQWAEVDADGLYMLDLNSPFPSSASKIEWNVTNKDMVRPTCLHCL